MSKIDDVNKYIMELKNTGEQIKNISDGRHTFAELFSYYELIHLKALLHIILN